MTEFDFTTVMDRRGRDAIAVDGVGKLWFAPDAPREEFDLIPMWIADMNFPAPSGITEAIIKRAQHPAFGYFVPSEAYYDAIIRWHQERNGIIGMVKDNIKTVQSNLGHHTAAFTLDQYGHVTDQMKKDSADRMQRYIDNLKTG